MEIDINKFSFYRIDCSRKETEEEKIVGKGNRLMKFQFLGASNHNLRKLMHN